MLTATERNNVVDRVRNGEHDAMNELLIDYHAGLVALVNRRLPPYLRGQLAEDLVQDAYASLWPKLATFEWRDPDPLAGFQAWLRMFVAGKVRDWWKHIQRLRRNLPGIIDHQEGTNENAELGRLGRTPGREETPSRAARRREREEALHKAMHDVLTKDEQVALVLRHFQLYSVAETAAIMERGPSAVKMLCLRGMEKLREALGRSSEFFSSK